VAKKDKFNPDIYTKADDFLDYLRGDLVRLGEENSVTLEFAGYDFSAPIVVISIDELSDWINDSFESWKVAYYG
jgi:hypothetical protein